MIDTIPERKYSRKRPFKFEVTWLKIHENFMSFSKGEEWCSSVEVLVALILGKLQSDLMYWNGMFYGELNRGRKSLNRRLMKCGGG